jgi:hypothetical protein
MSTDTENLVESFDWRPQPEAGWIVREILDSFCSRCAFARRFGEELHGKTGTRLMDWIDHIAVPAETEGEIWPVDGSRIDGAVADGAISLEEADRFRREGALGSHLEILQREDGYKGFNQAGINEIIRDTDPRRRS